jgi:hypothetical protein
MLIFGYACLDQDVPFLLGSAVDSMIGFIVVLGARPELLVGLVCLTGNQVGDIPVLLFVLQQLPNRVTEGVVTVRFWHVLASFFPAISSCNRLLIGKR